MRLLQSVTHELRWFYVSVSLLVITAGRGDCTEGEKKAREGKSKTRTDKAATGDGKGGGRRRT